MRGFATFRVLGPSFALAHPIDDRIVVGREPGRRFFVIMKNETDLEERADRMMARVRGWSRVPLPTKGSGARSSAPIDTDGVY
jgi:hypothetical protein